MIEPYSAYKENGNQKPTNIINSALKKLGENTKFSAYDVDHIFYNSLQNDDTDLIETFTIDGKELVFEGILKDLHLDDENLDKVTGQCPLITKITYDGKSIDKEIYI